MLGSFGLAFVLNFSLLLQILWYGTQVEELSIRQVFAADLGTPSTRRGTSSKVLTTTMATEAELAAMVENESNKKSDVETTEKEQESSMELTKR